MCTINENHMMCGSWDMECDGQNILSFWTVFALLLPATLTTQKIKILKKWKTSLGDNIILRKCTISDKHMMYGSWDIERDIQNFLLFWTIFCTFTPLTTWKIKILKRLKNVLEISSFYTNVPKIMIICYTVPEMRCVTDVILIFYFGLFFALLPLLWFKKSNFFKNEKYILRYHR